MAAEHDDRPDCTEDGCARPCYARGWCAMHHKRWQRTGTTFRAPRPRTCRVEGCDRDARTRGWCHGHYQRWRAHGDVRADVPLRTAAECAVAGCDRAPHGHGLCRSHLARRTAGELAEDIPIGEMPRPPVERRSRGWITNGYRYVPVPDHERHLTDGALYTAEHRLVVARRIGRALRADENVHHRNGDRLDNRSENLELWTTSQPSGQRVADRVEHALELLRRYRPQALNRPSPN